MPDIIYSRLGEIAAAVESVTKGTKVVSATLVDGTASKFKVYDIKWTPDISKHPADRASKSLTRYQATPGMTFGRISFRMDLYKKNVTATYDAWSVLWTSCGLAETSANNGIWRQTSDQTAHTTLTMYAFLGSTGGSSTNTVRVGIRGAMGTWKLVGQVGERAQIEFDFFGVHETADADGTPQYTFALKPTEDILNAPTYDEAIAAPFQGVSCTYGGTAITLPSFTLDAGNTLVMREDISSSGGGLHAAVVNREPLITIGPDFDLLAVKDYFGIHNLGTLAALAWTFTQPATSAPSLALRTFTFSAPSCQLVECNEGDRNGIKTAELTLAPSRVYTTGVPSAGEDEWTLAIAGS